MKTFLPFFLLFSSLISSLSAQPVISNAGNFPIGTILRFQKCETSGTTAGGAGANQMWNFSNLVAQPDTTTEWIIDPADAPHAGLFPTANLVEKYADGRYIYFNRTAAENQIVGFADVPGNLQVGYANPMLSLMRPLAYGNQATDTYSTQFSAGPYTFRGHGTVQLSADAYGILILPTGTFHNTVRLKITTQQADTMLQTGFVNYTSTVSYVWFNPSHSSALLKMDSVSGSTFSSQTVEYLLSETVTGNQASAQQATFHIFPNPATGHAFVSAPEQGELLLYNSLGQLEKQFIMNGPATQVKLEGLAPGSYFAIFQGRHQRHARPLIIQP